jgi:DNA transformation protein
MKADDPVPARVTRLLMPLGPVRARAMFGGCGIFLDDLMFALIAWDRLYFKVDRETKPRFAEAGGEPFVYQGKHKPVEMSYWTLPEERLADPLALIEWAELALAAARRARKKPARRRKA